MALLSEINLWRIKGMEGWDRESRENGGRNSTIENSNGSKWQERSEIGWVCFCNSPNHWGFGQ